MADNGDNRGGMLSQEDIERLRKARRLRELFHGRFSQVDACTLLRHHNWDLEQTLKFTLDALPGELRDVLGENDWHVVGAVRQDEVLRDLARRNHVGAEIRQFGCAEDDVMWWRRVPVRKPVGRCKVCKRTKRAIPREKEWGWAQFRCECGHNFRAHGMMDISVLGMGLDGKSKSLCWVCNQHLCEPIEILPPLKRNEERRRGRRRPKHTCTAPNCYNRCPPIHSIPIILICVHPNSLEGNVHDPSVDHISTGSTVKTFLTQDDLEEPYDAFKPSLADISEVRSESDVDDNN